MPLVAGGMAAGLRGELSGTPWNGSGPSLWRLNWLARDSSMLSSVVTALLPLKSRLSSLHSLLSSPREGWLAVRFSSRSLHHVRASGSVRKLKLKIEQCDCKSWLLLRWGRKKGFPPCTLSFIRQSFISVVMFILETQTRENMNK